jgi:integrase
LGKLNTERTVPLDEPTLAALVGWLATRGPQRALPRPRDGRLADFVFTTAGRRPGPSTTAALTVGRLLGRRSGSVGLVPGDGVASATS